MNVARSDVVLLNFPQGPGRPPKRRPAVVIQSNHNNSRLTNSIFVMVSSNIRLATTESTQVLVNPSTPEGRQSGLAKSRRSSVRTSTHCQAPALSASLVGYLRH